MYSLITYWKLLHFSKKKNYTVISSTLPQVKYRAGTNTLGIIVFCLVFGTLLGSLGKKGAVVVDFFSVIDTVILKIVTGVMWWVSVFIIR